MAIRGAHAVLSVETILEVLAMRVEEVQDSIGISLFTSSEGNYLEILSEFIQARLEMRPNIQPNVLTLGRAKIGDLDSVLASHVCRVTLINGMNHGLVNIED